MSGIEDLTAVLAGERNGEYDDGPTSPAMPGESGNADFGNADLVAEEQPNGYPDKDSLLDAAAPAIISESSHVKIFKLLGFVAVAMLLIMLVLYMNGFYDEDMKNFNNYMQEDDADAPFYQEQRQRYYDSGMEYVPYVDY